MAATACLSSPGARGAAMPDRFTTLAWALACDQLVPELPNRLHPVVWLGRWLSLGERLAPRGPSPRA